MGYVYILKCTDKNKNVIYYVGSTTRTITERLSEHRKGWSRYTKRFVEHKLIYLLQCSNLNIRSVERYIKTHPRCKSAMVKHIWTDARYNFRRWLNEHGITAESLAIVEK